MHLKIPVEGFCKNLGNKSRGPYTAANASVFPILNHPDPSAFFITPAFASIGLVSSKSLLSNLLSENSVTNDEVSYLNKNAQAIDPPPNRLVGITPRKILKTVAPQYSDLELDLDQNILVKLKD